MIPLKPFLDPFFMKIQKKLVAAIGLKCIMSVSSVFYMIFGTIETIFRSIFHEDSEKIGPGDRIEVHHVRFERFLWDANA